MTRHIRMLENRFDKALIKYNEAQSIRKTYEQIVKRLREAGGSLRTSTRLWTESARLCGQRRSRVPMCVELLVLNDPAARSVSGSTTSWAPSSAPSRPR